MMGRKGAVGVGVMGLTFLFGFIGVASADATTTTCAGDAAPATVLSLPDLANHSLVGDELRNTRWNSLGVKHYQSGQIELALQYFTVGTKAKPMDVELWRNLGVALNDAGDIARGKYGPEVASSKFDGGGRLVATAFLCEAVAALELSSALGGEQSIPPELFGAFREMYSSEGDACASASSSATECFEKACDAGRASRYGRARLALADSDHFSAVDLLCVLDATEMTVRPKAWERERQALSAHSAFTIWALFRVCGVVAVTDVLEGEAVERVSDGANAYMIERQADIDALRAANDASTDEDGVPSEGSSISLRDLTGNAKRYGIKLPFERAPFTESVVDDENLLSLVKMLSLSDQLTLDTYNTVVSLPGCVRMHWHADVDDPFDFLSRLTRTPTHFSPPGVVVLVPLTDVNSTNGPTAFRMGSHVRVRGNKASDAQHDPKWLSPYAPIDDDFMRRTESRSLSRGGVLFSSTCESYTGAARIMATRIGTCSISATRCDGTRTSSTLTRRIRMSGRS